MKIRLISVGTRMPSWVKEGTTEYSKRIERDLNFSLVEVPLAKRAKNQSAEVSKAKEGVDLRAQIKPGDYVVALDVVGKPFSTADLAGRIQNFRADGRDLAFLVGGPDGLDAACLAWSDARWSLSALTLPHPLVRILMIEQLYRAASIISGHPYHRE
ncbi:MAG TPA: 23S rRNA (pseudouridine(1915)-N(3))-methyltransferase RlmH [Gammaproteobacteria bacterium]|nr:23S rRNA (pseudouridine(1915)-N(3))-methyltransferase RlmH [Gammaproteobacteria bacterium]